MSDSPEERNYDVVVIGAGPVGENVAATVQQNGLTAVVVERELVGGECSYYACIPSKALLRPSAALAAAQDVPGSRAAVTGDLDVPAVFESRDAFTSHWTDDGQAEWLTGAGIDLVRGHGRITGDRVVTVSGDDGSETVLRANHAVVVSTGSDAAMPDVPGLAEANPWTSRGATASAQVPDRLTVIGGGVVACEMTEAYASFGSRVTMLVRGDQLLPSVDAFAGNLVAGAFRNRGVDIRFGVTATKVTSGADATVVHTDTGSAVRTDEILVAVGRTPRTSGIGLDTVGLPDGGWLDGVEDTCQVQDVADGWLYAVGDVNHRALLTHMGKYQARACGAAIAARADGRRVGRVPWSRYVATADHTAVTQVVFTRPEVAAVGFSHRQARDAGLRVRTIDFPIGDVAGAALHAEGYTGQARIVVDEQRHVIVGATFAGPDVSDLLHSATVAVVGEVPLDRLWHAVPAFPTVSEVWLRLLEKYYA